MSCLACQYPLLPGSSVPATRMVSDRGQNCSMIWSHSSSPCARGLSGQPTGPESWQSHPARGQPSLLASSR
eukprot:3680192-Heterocapsa_arctica.AAC.1